MVYQNKAYNFILRVVTACFLAPIVLMLIHLGGYYFTTMIVAAAMIMGGEWLQMSTGQKTSFRVLGAFYILAACMSLLWIIKQHYVVHNTVKFNGVNTVISIFVLVWANDIGAFIFGRLFGGPKLCPKVSPNKTWSGFFGGIALAIAVSPIVAEGFGAAGIAAMIASVGDLIESWAKRKCKVKDSGNLIPGHGGLLDRVDAILLLSIVVALMGLWSK